MYARQIIIDDPGMLSMNGNPLSMLLPNRKFRPVRQANGSPYPADGKATDGFPHIRNGGRFIQINT